MFSFFEKLFHPFECPNPNCRHKFYGLSRWLIHANEVVCPKCGNRKPSSDIEQPESAVMTLIPRTIQQRARKKKELSVR
jgi:hypothetical protein